MKSSPGCGPEGWERNRNLPRATGLLASGIRLRTSKTRNCGSRATTLAMVFKLAQSAEKGWRRLKDYELLGEVITGVIFKDGIRVSDQSAKSAA